jgi:hypothetical protein
VRSASLGRKDLRQFNQSLPAVTPDAAANTLALHLGNVESEVAAILHILAGTVDLLNLRTYQTLSSLRDRWKPRQSRRTAWAMVSE